ncbi:MAG: DUF2569 family protein [Myxococcaceae bacterium]|nr:DUF2569 family protein [Myxococcaceae bacterium]
MCAQCARTLGGGTFCETCEPQPRAFGGWLILALVVLFASPLKVVAVVVPLALEVADLDDLAMVFDAENAEWRRVAVFNVATSLLSAVVAGVTLNHALRKRQKAIGWFQAFFATNLLVNLSLLIFEAVSRSPGAPVPAWGSLVWPFVVSIAWLQYFQSNPRVKETFVR